MESRDYRAPESRNHLRDRNASRLACLQDTFALALSEMQCSFTSFSMPKAASQKMPIVGITGVNGTVNNKDGGSKTLSQRQDPQCERKNYIVPKTLSQRQD